MARRPELGMAIAFRGAQKQQGGLGWPGDIPAFVTTKGVPGYVQNQQTGLGVLKIINL